MSKQIQELQEKRSKLLADCKGLCDKADKESGGKLCKEQDVQYRTMFEEATDLKKEIDRRSDLEKQEREDQTTNRADKPETILQRSNRSATAVADEDGDDDFDSGDGEVETRARDLATREIRNAIFGEGYFNLAREAHLHSSMTRRNGLTVRPQMGDMKRHFPERSGKKHEKNFRAAVLGLLASRMPLADRNFMTAEERSLSAGLLTEGGATYMSEQFLNQLIKFVDDETFVRRLANVIQVRGADSIGAPSLDADPADSDWTAELSTGSEDSTMAFGKRVLTPHAVAKRIKISNTLVQRSAMDIIAFVQERLAYKFGITLEKAFMTGTGAGQPLGIFTASTQGISTGRDVSTDNTTTAMTADGIKNAFYSLKESHRREAVGLFHRDGILQLSKLKDGEGRYMWHQSMTEGEPDRVLGRPAFSSEYAPNTFTTGLYVGIFGNFRWYWLVEALTYQVQRLSELYAETNQTGLIGRMEADGAPVLEEAFARVKLG